MRELFSFFFNSDKFIVITVINNMLKIKTRTQGGRDSLVKITVELLNNFCIRNTTPKKKTKNEILTYIVFPFIFFIIFSINRQMIGKLNPIIIKVKILNL